PSAFDIAERGKHGECHFRASTVRATWTHSLDRHFRGLALARQGETGLLERRPDGYLIPEGICDRRCFAFFMGYRDRRNNWTFKNRCDWTNWMVRYFRVSSTGLAPGEDGESPGGDRAHKPW